MNKGARFRHLAAWTALFFFAITTLLLERIGHNVRLFQLAYAVGFLGYLALVMETWRVPGCLQTGRWRWSLLGCVALRVLLIPTVPSDDIYRYAWEGRIQHAGFNPYVHAPDDPALESLRDEDWAMINHPDYPAIYGPIAQIQFRLITAISSNVALVKAFQVLWDLLTIIILGSCLRQLGKNPNLALVYGLNPLILTAFGVEGHLDSLFLLFITVSIWAMLTKRLTLVGVPLGMALGVKIVPVVLLPWFLFRMHRIGIIAVLVCCAGYLPYLDAGEHLFESLRRFGGGDMFFSPLALMNATLGISQNSLLQLERIIAAAALAVFLLFIARHNTSFHSYALLALSATLIASPIVHYWYVTWVLVMVPFHVRAPWVASSFAILVYFEASRIQELTGEWAMPVWCPATVWSVLLLTWAIDRRHGLRRNGPPSSNAHAG